MWMIRLAEGSLLLGLGLLVVAGAYLMRLWCREPAEEYTFKSPELPAKYLLLQHAELRPRRMEAKTPRASVPKPCGEAR